MDYEKKYKEAIKRASNIHKDAVEMENNMVTKTCEVIFPELAESEDEKIRKELITHCRNTKCVTEEGAERIAKWIAWLEKQNSNIDNANKEYWRGYREGKKEILDKYAELEKPGKHLENFDEAEKEKSDFVGDGFIECHANFLDFKEGNTYWLEYIGDDKYNVRSDNLLGKTYHITPCQLYTIFKKLTWLEQKPAEKAEPKFKVGDWIINRTDATIMQVVNNEDFYESVEINGQRRTDTYNYIEWDFRLWTIQDAKDGDVIVCPKYAGDIIPNIFIFKNIEIKDNNVICHCSFSKAFRTEGYIANADPINTDFYPATKEQREQLEKAMADAGYTFDSDRKELKKIEDEEYDGEDYGIDSLWHAKTILEKTLGRVDGYQTDDGILEHKCAISAVNKLYEQKPAWSEEDEWKFSDILALLRGGENCHYNTPDLFDWLKSIKDRVGCEVNCTTTKEWSEEDEDKIVLIKKAIYSLVNDGITFTDATRLCDWLNSLRPQKDKEE